jgi:hypothetical protein
MATSKTAGLSPAVFSAIFPHFLTISSLAGTLMYKGRKPLGVRK